MPNLSQIKRQRMLDFLETLKKEHTDDKSIRAFTEIENQLRDKKYGLVWEEHSERVDELLEENIPIFTEDVDKKITASADGVYNFILEGIICRVCIYLIKHTERKLTSSISTHLIILGTKISFTMIISLAMMMVTVIQCGCPL